ncbi:MAG: hypothetical protein JWO96_789 [Candidatus Saccharibacteria bacterium]|nr:hypothetical protein [Candidatus Saccharibacteria bacterium]
MHITPSFDLFSKSKQLVLDNLNILWPFFLLQLLFLMNNWLTNPASVHGTNRVGYDITGHSVGIASPTFPNYSWSLFLGIGFFAIIWIVVSIIFQIMLQRAQLDIIEGKKSSFSHLWATVKELGWRMVGLYLLTGLYILIGLILIIPGIIMFRRYFLAPYVMLDRKCSIKEAMERSAAISKPYSGYIWGVIGVMVLISLLGIIPFIGSLVAFVVGALYSLAPALRYQELKKLS